MVSACSGGFDGWKPVGSVPMAVGEGTADQVLERTAFPSRSRARSRRRPWVTLVIGMGVIVGAIAFLAYQGLSNSLVYYITPSELLAKGHGAVGEQLRLGGQVRPGSKHWNGRTHILTFVLQDPHSHVRVVSRGLPPPLFRARIGAVVQGVYRHGTFHASALMIKHSADYEPPKPGHLPKSDRYAHH